MAATDDGDDPHSTAHFVHLKRGLHGQEKDFNKSVDAGQPNYGYVAMAIGLWVSRRGFPNSKPPAWAIEACRELYERADRSSRPVIGASHGPAAQPLDDDWLELIADIMIDRVIQAAHGFDKAPSVRSVVMHVLGSDVATDDADVQRLSRLWRKECAHRRARAVVRMHRKYEKLGVLWKPK